MTKFIQIDFIWVTIAVFSIICFVIGYFGTTLIDYYLVNSVSIFTKVITTSDSLKPSIEFSNEYTLTRPLSGSYPWENIVEPYRTTNFQVKNPSTLYSYSWYIDEWHHSNGETTTIVFGSPTGERQIVKVEARDLKGEIVSTTELSVMVKYVRREIRSLNDQDREAFFQAVAILQRVPTQVGKRLYGTHYRSKDFFNRIHLYFGGNKSCDHWHQGPGFATSHITFSLMYEQALQAVNPSLSLPYWDFTLDSTFFTPDTFRDHGVFSEDWFGDSVCNNSMHTPLEGRFAQVPVMADAHNFSSLTNPYGLLRSPWNADPTPYMTRSSLIYNLPNNLKPSGCTEYNHAFGFKDWKNLAKQLNSNLHGHIHELMGGSWNPLEGISVPEKEEGRLEAFEFAHATEAYSKVLWRFGFLECPSSCSPETPTSECQCMCTEDSLRNFSAAHILANTDIIRTLVFFDKEGNAITDWQNKSTRMPYESLPGYSLNETQALYSEVLELLCSPGHIGDMFQATSTNDITFWVLHPNLERLWHLVRLNVYNNNIDFDESWPDDEMTCSGHFSYNPTPFKNIFDENNQVYTNAELYELINPTRDAFPYVYDNFRWSHCEFLGQTSTFSNNIF